MNKIKKAIVLFSGGLDSTTCLAWALKKGYECFALSVNYGQRHARENESAAKIADLLRVKLISIELKLPWLKSATSLVGGGKVPTYSRFRRKIPSTYVPGRNLIFVSMGVSFADAIGAGAVILGPNAVDYSGYPDCRPPFYKSLEKSVNLGTKKGALGGKIKLLTPIINFSKSEIIKLAFKLGAPLKYTWSCYKGGKAPCGKCDSCVLRARGFKEAGFRDPALE